MERVVKLSANTPKAFLAKGKHLEGTEEFLHARTACLRTHHSPVLQGRRGEIKFFQLSLAPSFRGYTQTFSNGLKPSWLPVLDLAADLTARFSSIRTPDTWQDVRCCKRIRLHLVHMRKG